ncbi:MAG: PP2C family protein-serine/threonine phosphatase [Melioribacteraceae bacterium]|nr:PP2C family protein-serine/threonine phosphatase [Melioribacteraceae bacterium]
MKADLITEKLSFQVQSFQESFELLSGSNSISDMAKHFTKILKGSFFTTTVIIYHQKNEKSKWISLVKENDEKLLKQVLKNASHLKITSTKDSKNISTVIDLVDSSKMAIHLGKRFDGSSYSEIDKITFQIFAQLLDNSYQSFLSQKKEKTLIFSLNNRIAQLYSLVDTGIEISKLQQSRSLLRLSLERMAGLTDASNGLLTIKKAGKRKRFIKFPSTSIALKDIEDCPNKISASFEHLDEEYNFTLSEKESRSGCIPFDQTDQLLLDAIVSQANAALENFRLHKAEIERENIQKELDVAASIQQKIIPDSMPSIPGFDIAGRNVPSKEVGGDYYDCMQLSDNRFALIMADVAGKGVPASLLVSTLNASLAAYLDLKVPMADLAVKINSIIYKSSPPDKFITFLIAVLNSETGELDIVNAGHNPGLILRKNGKMEKIDPGGVALGMFDMGLPFDGEAKKLHSGDRLFLFTDGIPEAMDPKENEYSDERLEEFFLKNKTKTAEEFITKIFDDVKKFTKSAPQSDDITGLYLIKF